MSHKACLFDSTSTGKNRAAAGRWSCFADLAASNTLPLQNAGLVLDQIAAIVRIYENASHVSSTDAALLAATLEQIDTQLEALRRTRSSLDLLAIQTQRCSPAESNRWEPNSTNHIKTP